MLFNRVIPEVLYLISIPIAVFIGIFLCWKDIVMANNGFIFVSKASGIHNFYIQACRFVKNRLYIKVNDNKSQNILPILSQQIENVYSKVEKECEDIDIRLMLNTDEPTKSIKTSCPIDLLMYDKDVLKPGHNYEKFVELLKEGWKEITLESIDSKSNLKDEISDFKTYDYVAVGGTFDRLHNGHKILLSEAALRSTKHVTVGVTDLNMIKSKKLWELIESIEDRIESVLSFLSDIKPNLEYNVVPIQDLYGPTKDDPKYQMIVVSEETVRGADKINEKRTEIGLLPLDRYVINLAEDKISDKSEEEECKVSSSNKRMRLLGTMLKPPQPNPKIPDWPYVIGLAGGIASGKSRIADRLKDKGAAVINCDIIAHELYKPGLPLNATIANAFGDHVISQNGDVDRKVLGQIVFSDKAKLEQLNQLVWPAVIEEVQRRIQALGKEGYRVVVMEAAVMIRAKWYENCHQLWTVIIPPEEAIKRIIDRNGLTEEEARQRVESQPSNSEQVAVANVVFSPYWSYEYTQSQIDKAWDELQRYLAEK